MSSSSAPDKFVVTFWGTRGSIPTPGRITEKYGGNTPCVAVQHKDTIIILDAGSGIRNYGLVLAEEFANDGSRPIHLFLSHTHWDHIQGLPFFAPAYMPGTELTILGRKGAILKEILAGQMSTDYFPIDMSMLAAKLDVREMSSDVIQIGDVTVDWQEQVEHPGGCARYRLQVGDKRLVYASDVELDKIFYPDEPSEEREQLAQEYIDFVRGADLLIADGQYTEEEYKSKRHWGHTSIPVILDVAYQAGVKQVAVFHHDPLASDKHLDALWVQYNAEYSAKSPPMTIFWAREGLTVPIISGQPSQ